LASHATSITVLAASAAPEQKPSGARQCAKNVTGTTKPALHAFPHLHFAHASRTFDAL
jgi:hypothetical protein